jgi:colanic acid biosynthesis glycosyl transferase WcaI
MHFAFLGINYWPDETGIAPFTTGRCEYLASRGHHVTVFTGFPYYPAWRIPDEYRGRLFRREIRNGVTIIRSWLYVPARVNSMRRILHEASFTASSLVRAVATGNGDQPDVLIVTTPPLALSLAAVALSRIWKIPYVQHVPDLQPDAAVDLGMLRPGRVTNLLYRIERIGYRNAALVSTLTETMREKIIGKGIATDKVVLFSDWARSELFSVPAVGGAQFRRSAGLGDDELLVVHAGNMGVKQGLDVILGAAERSRSDRSIKYLLVGDGAVRARLQNQARSLSLDNVRFMPLLPDSQFLDLLAASNISLVTQQKGVADIVFPSKVITLMSSARAIVASVSAGSEVARVLKKADAGELVAPEDPGALHDAIMTLRAEPARRMTMGANGRRFAEHFWEKQNTLAVLESSLLRVAAGRKSGGSEEAAELNKPFIVKSEESRQ